MQRIRAFLLFLMVSLVILGLPAHASGLAAALEPDTTAVVRIAPAAVSLNPGQSRTIQVTIENVVDLYGFDVIVGYDADRLTLVLANFGGFLDAGLTNTIDTSTPGEIQFIRAQQSPSEPKSGEGVLAYFTVRAKETLGETALTCAEITLSDRDSFAIPSTSQPGTVTVTDEPLGSTVYLPLVMR